MKESRATGRAGCFEPGARDPIDPGARCHVGRQMILSDERRAGEIAEIERFNLIGTAMRVLQAFLNCFRGEGAQIAVGKCSERSFPDADYGYGSHMLSEYRRNEAQLRPQPADNLTMTLRVFLLCLAFSLTVAAQGPFGKKKGSAPASSGPKMSSTQQSNVDKLKGDLATMQAGSQVTPAMKQQLAADLTAMCEGATKPSQASIDKLATDLTAAMADKKLSQAEIAKLTADIYKVLNSAGISADEFNAVVADAKAILTASGVNKNSVQLIVADLQAIGAEFQTQHPTSKTLFRKK
jgi:hypothetical protein